MNKRFTILYMAILLLSIKINAQPIFLKDIPNDSKNFISANGKLYFTRGDSLYRSDGSPSGTVFVKEIGEPINQLTNFVVGSFFYFTTNEPGGKTALWKSNGFSNNTYKIRSANILRPLITYHGSLYVGMYEFATGYELWRVTSGNAFMLVKDIYPGSLSGLGNEIIIENDFLYFKATTGSGGVNIWKSNGTSFTAQAVDLPFNDYISLTTVNSTIYFTRTLEDSNNKTAQLWKTNGTQAGTSLVKEFVEADPEICNLFINNLIVYNNKLYFDLITGCGLSIDNLYASDGTEGGTSLVKTINLDGSISPFITVANKIVYYGTSQGFPGSFSRSNGTVGGTAVFHNLNTEPPRKFIGVGNLLFFADHTEANIGALPINPDNYYQLYQSGLESSNTETLRDLFGTSFPGTNNLTDANGKLFFTTYNDHPSIPVASRVMKLYYYKPGVSMKAAATPEGESETAFAVYPNPSTSNFNFSVTSISTGTATADIYRTDGSLVKRIFEADVKEGETIEFNLTGTDLPDGIYFCRYTSGSETKVKRIILRK